VAFGLIKKPGVGVQLERQELSARIAKHVLDLLTDKRFPPGGEGDRLAPAFRLIDDPLERIHGHHPHVIAALLGEILIDLVAEDAAVVADGRRLNLQAGREIIQDPALGERLVAIAIKEVPGKRVVGQPVDFLDHVRLQSKRRSRAGSRKEAEKLVAGRMHLALLVGSQSGRRQPSGNRPDAVQHVPNLPVVTDARKTVLLPVRDVRHGPPFGCDIRPRGPAAATVPL